MWGNPLASIHGQFPLATCASLDSCLNSGKDGYFTEVMISVQNPVIQD
jgi:hypothetical protein